MHIEAQSTFNYTSISLSVSLYKEETLLECQSLDSFSINAEQLLLAVDSRTNFRDSQSNVRDMHNL